MKAVRSKKPDSVSCLDPVKLATHAHMVSVHCTETCNAQAGHFDSTLWDPYLMCVLRVSCSGTLASKSGSD